MDFRFTDEQEVFRGEVRQFLADNLDLSLSRKVKLGYPIEKAEQDNWTRLLNAKGWAAPNWPTLVGGQGWSMVRRHLFDIEMRLHHAPELQGFVGGMTNEAGLVYGIVIVAAIFLGAVIVSTAIWIVTGKWPSWKDALGN